MTIEPRYGVWDLARQVAAEADGSPRRLTAAAAALLRSWNQAYYQRRPDEVPTLVVELGGLATRTVGTGVE